MFEKFSRSWGLVKASATVLRSDKELMLFPMISAIATLLVLVSFAVPVIGWRVFENGFGASGVVWGFLFYFCQYTVIIFFNSALVGAAMIRLDGGDPSLRDGFNIAKDRIVPILGYAAIAATVGIALKWLKDQDNVLVRLIGSGAGVAWTLATFMVVPVLVSHDVGPVVALKKSASLLKRTWGENAIGTVGIGMVFGLASFGVILLGGLLAFVAFQLSIWLGGVVVVLAILALMALGVVQAALSGVYSAALYQFATHGETPVGFEALNLESAFAPK
ncbi:DUF6159 family protein [Montanilutibacter psychrotolerans]|uniref:Glycerophosphoryl diester phosphodiesterase membrane domain-containing protein n=1 Tax=Montanilutibacter psychrotolerans TaxID=1327343 RepID=A0A3M8SVL0_9GAMM|nr:DUF6159 family protein [Lysobacter psychrotolerans]RNF82890.1 hypothetical protein EER27_13385 [Lysobacter psychrotolerans]